MNGDDPTHEPPLSGGCHCGDVRFTVRAPLERVLRCNCSICTKKGFLHFIVEGDEFELETPAQNLATYTFGTHTAKHHFCKRCGIASFYIPRSHPDGVSVNARCLDGVDPESLLIEPFDGQRWEENVGRINESLGPAPS
jgi:hypothetical protein